MNLEDVPRDHDMVSVTYMIAYIKAMDGYYHLIAPQFYNHHGDGLWPQEVNGSKGALTAQNNNAMKEAFLYYLGESLVIGTRSFTRNALDHFGIGLPASVNAAATGYVVNPISLTSALTHLDTKGLLIRDLMTWSVNWGCGFDKKHEPYNQEFSRVKDPHQGRATISLREMTPLSATLRPRYRRIEQTQVHCVPGFMIRISCLW